MGATHDLFQHVTLLGGAGIHPHRWRRHREGGDQLFVQEFRWVQSLQLISTALAPVNCAMLLCNNEAKITLSACFQKLFVKKTFAFVRVAALRIFFFFSHIVDCEPTARLCVSHNRAISSASKRQKFIYFQKQSRIRFLLIQIMNVYFWQSWHDVL